ncbi:MAG TPA: TAXI family TRAP transporter solute-binding subunit [Candidatus Acidoferrales bacterium]|nr:TAXI family TRAP transporter solute-binding subunit [Candidatus Acidoferrales bacterium]
MNRSFNLKFAVTGEARGEIVARVVLAFYQVLRGTPNQVSFIFGSADSELGGTGAPLSVGKKKYDLALANPASLARMAVLGKGFYKKKIPLRAIGVFPSWDRLVFAVHPRTGIRSLDDLKEKRYPLRVSTRQGGKYHSTLFAIDRVLEAHAFSLADIERWGGKILRAASPSSADRREHIESGAVDAVFDEGVKSWAPLALKAGMRFLGLSDEVLRALESTGYGRAPLGPEHYPQLDRAVETVDFSGWLLFSHRELAHALAYQVAAAVDRAHERLPSDHFDGRPMTMREFCRGGDGGPLTIPLHPGAKKYFAEKAWL